MVMSTRSCRQPVNSEQYKQMTSQRQKIFVLDTNVLIHDPSALFQFKQHDVYLPLIVLEELDRAKVGMSDIARNVRQASRFLDELVENNSGDLSQGISLPADLTGEQSGRLFFYTAAVETSLPAGLATTSSDNTILGISLDLGKQFPDRQLVLVSKDVNLRIKACVLGVHAEDYTKDQVLDDVNLLHTGIIELETDFWDRYGQEMTSWQEAERTYYRLQGSKDHTWLLNQFIYTTGDNGFAAIVRQIDPDSTTIETITDYTSDKNRVWGIRARNLEQSFALNLLMDPEIDFISLLGQAGTGKTLLTLAAALTQTLETKLYNDIIMTRTTVPVGEDIGFLPGSEREKMEPWMGALEDNLDVLNGSVEHGAWGRAATHDFLRNRVHIKSLNFMRGRTFLKKFIIIDEAQNLTPNQIKTLVTRAGPGTKVVCLGNIAQIDTPYLTETTTGLTYVIDRFKNWHYSGHVTLRRGERSRLADYATEIL